MKIKTPARANFSRYAKLCDQNLYHDSSPSNQQPPNYQSPSAKQKLPENKNFYFKSVSRQKRGNFRWSIKATKGQFIYNPQDSYVKSKSPSWTFRKKQRYENNKYEQYQFCSKHPLLKQEKQTKMLATGSMKQFQKQKVALDKCNLTLRKNVSMVSTSVDFHKNYSLLNPRSTSPSGFFNQSKIKKPIYLSKKDLKEVESAHDQRQYKKQLLGDKKGLVELDRQTKRPTNVNRKKFEYLIANYKHQKQFNNFQMTQYPIQPNHHIDMDKHLDRVQLFNTSGLGPNSETFNIDFVRKSDTNINYKLVTFRNKIQTKFDRMQVQPNTRIDIDLPQRKLSGMVKMEDVISRNKQLFPIVDPIIKKPGQKQMKASLKKQVFKFQINQAMSPVKIKYS